MTSIHHPTTPTTSSRHDLHHIQRRRRLSSSSLSSMPTAQPSRPFLRNITTTASWSLLTLILVSISFSLVTSIPAPPTTSQKTIRTSNINSNDNNNNNNNINPSTKKSTVPSQTSRTLTPVSNKNVVRPTSTRLSTYKLSKPSCAAPSRGRAKTFLMVFMGHSGSSAIMSELWQHPDVLIENPEAVDHGDYQFNTTLALQFTRDFFKRGIAANKTPGFKIRPRHILQSPKEWQSLVREFDTRLIWQYRRNTLKQTVGEYSYVVLNDSNILEGLRSEYEVKHRCTMGVGCSFRVDDFDKFHVMLRQSMRTDRSIADAADILVKGRNDDDCIHEVRYEDYLYNREGTMQDLHEFLGLKHMTFAPKRFKATGDNLCDVVDNWAELCRAFYGCATWRRFFEDEINGCSCKFSMSPSKYCNASPW